MNLVKNTLLGCGAILAIFAGAIPTEAQSNATETVTWQLATDARVDSSGIFLNQIIIPTPPVVLPQIRLAPAPPLGQASFFSREQIFALAQSNIAGLTLSNLAGPARIRVLRRTRALAESDMLDLLTTALQRDYVKDLGELELRFARPWTAVEVPDESLNVTITEVPGSGVNANFLAGFELWNGRERVGRWQSVVQAKVWRQVPIAHTPLTRGQLLKDTDVTMERRDVLAVRDTLLNIPTDDNTLELAENIPSGMPVLNRAVRRRPVVRRGQLVEAVFNEGSLRISLKVETLEDGALGQTVRVRNPKTKRELSGKVQNDESISITL